MFKKDENQDTEFKESWRDEYIKWICGFANAKGGKIYVGVDDGGYIKGIKNYKKLLEDIPNKVLDLLGISVDVSLEYENDKKYIAISIEPYPYPISYKGQYHYRTGSTKKELKGAALDKFLLKKQGKKWDGVPVPYIGVEQLDNNAIEFFKEKAIKKKRIESNILDENNNGLIEKLHLYEGEYLKRATVLLFSKEPEKYVTGSYIKIGYFKSDSELIYQDTVRGNILEQVEKCEELVFTKYLKAYISYEGMQRVESFPISQLAFREVIINAIVHKDYGDETPIQISIYDDKVMIYNSGELPENWTIDTLLEKHSSKPYNPAIANVFFLAGFVESWGRGIDKITQESKRFNSIIPKFKFNNGLWVEFDFSKNSKKLGIKEKTRVKTRVKILELINENPNITNQELADTLELTIKGIQWQIKNLKDENILKRVGSARSGYWEIIDERS
ncbi:MAG: ATP-binding protein [Campylobacterota bacterium]|nr:ATP-binding protein [Campylobacterota bacterium]